MLLHKSKKMQQMNIMAKSEGKIPIPPQNTGSFRLLSGQQMFAALHRAFVAN